MSDVFELGKKRTFTLQQARELLPAVRRVTERSVHQVDGIVRETRRAAGPSEADAEERINAVIRLWAEQIARLGCEAKGLWLVDFDTGAGYYCWKYPEERVEFFHGYDEGFGGRVQIQ